MGFQQGLSGLNAASKNLDVIGHNIANANTTGFKASRAEFSALVAASMGAGSANNAGFGVETAAVAQQFTQGSMTSTGNGLDLAINGNGFFKVQQPNGSEAYTRAGNFKLNKTGDLITNSGAKVMGYMVDATTKETSSTPVPLNFPIGTPVVAKQTTTAKLAFNLDARAKEATADPAATPPRLATPRSTYGTSFNVYDAEGIATPVNLYFEKGAANTWNVFAGLDTTTPAVTFTALTPALVFGASGKITTPAPGTPFALTVTTTANPNAPAATIPVNIDLSSITQFGSKFAVSDIQQDGYASGELTGVNIGADGSVVGSYSNGTTSTVAQVALANFRNPQGLTPIGDNNWTESISSGPPVLGKPESGTFGSLRSGALEDSNVDLTAELVNMMTAQRSYQANAQTIKTQDQVISTIVNLR